MQFHDPVHPSIQVWVTQADYVQFKDHYFETSDQKVASSLRCLVESGTLRETGPPEPRPRPTSKTKKD